ncbi:MAG: hypothetical protein KOO62_12645 [candidate division Zixibacteria bacterium]|nr:hypothetical protein [candidate division Zixibacteria bacterium]
MIKKSLLCASLFVVMSFCWTTVHANEPPRSLTVQIEKIDYAYLGMVRGVRVMISGQAAEVTEFDFLFAYYSMGFTFLGVTPGDFDSTAEWESLVYHAGPPDLKAQDRWPYDTVRVKGVFSKPVYLGGGDNDSMSTLLFTLDLKLTNDRTFTCMNLPIRFCWWDCDDNTIVRVDEGESEVGSSTVLLSDRVYEPYEWEITRPDTSVPTFFGALHDCDNAKSEPTLRSITYVNGVVGVVCFESIDGRGDMNLNGLSIELDDERVFMNYFLYGDSIFTHQDAQRAASDMDMNGNPLTIADLALMARIIDKDFEDDFSFPDPPELRPWILPGPNGELYKPGLWLSFPTGEAALIRFPSRVALATDDSLSVVYMIFEGVVNPSLIDPELNLYFANVGDSTRVLVTSFHTDKDIVSGALVEWDGEGELVEAQAATHLSGQVVIVIR